MSGAEPSAFDEWLPCTRRSLGSAWGFHVVGTAVGNLCVWITLLRETSVCGGVGKETTVKKQFTPWMKSLWGFHLDRMGSLAFDVSLKWDHFVSNLIFTGASLRFTVRCSFPPHPSYETGTVSAASSLLWRRSEELSNLSKVAELTTGQDELWTWICLIPKLSFYIYWMEKKWSLGRKLLGNFYSLRQTFWIHRVCFFFFNCNQHKFIL